jgi:UDP-glucose 4-epimerase
MAVLVTGGAGYVGSNVVRALVDSNCRTVVLDDLSTGFREAVHPKAKLVVGDVGNREVVDQVLAEQQVDAVIHLAAKTDVAESLGDPLLYYRANTLKSHVLVEAVFAAKIKRFIFSSTAAVYGRAIADRVREESTLAPLSPYGASKLMTERMLEDLSRIEALNYVALRCFNVAGADPEGRKVQGTRAGTSLIKTACEAAAGLRPGVDIFGSDYPTRDGSAVRDYVHVSDVAQAHLAALEHLRNGGASLTANCGSGRGASVLEVLEAVKRVSGVNFAVRCAPRRRGDAAIVVADTDRIQTTLQWQPKFADLTTIIAHSLAWEGISHT